jgi:beta-mannosidase
MAKPSNFSVHCLSDGWTFRQADDDTADAWMSVKSIPTNVHLDLMDHGKYVALNY